ncbi:Conserved_hypothetical protein [Hexamita inflata]|uniref:Myb-like domain-containing protein n=1 Tax=Hexamita inflata TaxID=28002 RepID=A0ABP1IK44_9EUKA
MNRYHKWTKEDEEIFRDALIKFQCNWSRIQCKVLPHISIKSMKNKYYQRIHNNADIKIQIKSQKQQNKAQQQSESKQDIQERAIYNYIRNLINE